MDSHSSGRGRFVLGRHLVALVIRPAQRQRARQFGQQQPAHLVARRFIEPVQEPATAGWFAEAGETWVLLRLLGVDLSFAAVLAFEPVVSFARSAAFFIPAGLGVQDAGYMAFLRQAGGTPRGAGLASP